MRHLRLANVQETAHRGASEASFQNQGLPLRSVSIRFHHRHRTEDSHQKRSLRRSSIQMRAQGMRVGVQTKGEPKGTHAATHSEEEFRVCGVRQRFVVEPTKVRFRS